MPRLRHAGSVFDALGELVAIQNGDTIAKFAQDASCGKT
jgi:hypothetical protein